MRNFRLILGASFIIEICNVDMCAYMYMYVIYFQHAFYIQVNKYIFNLLESKRKNNL